MNKSILTLAAGVLLGLGAFGLFGFQPEATVAEAPVATVAPSAPSAPKSGDILVIRNTIGSGAWSRIMTTYPDGKTEVIKLGNFDPQNFVNNNELLTQQLNKVRKEGYKLVGTNGGGAGGGFAVSYYLFEKI